MHLSLPSNSFARLLISPTTIWVFISCCDIITPCSPTALPFFPLPGPIGNEPPQRSAANWGSVGGQGHTCVHYTGLCVSPQSGVEWGTKVKHIKKIMKGKKNLLMLLTARHRAPFWDSCGGFLFGFFCSAQLTTWVSSQRKTVFVGEVSLFAFFNTLGP